MKALKRLVLLAVVVALAWGALQAWESPYFALYQIHQGLEEKDAVRVERYVDLERLFVAGADVLAALTKERAGLGGTDLGSQVLGGILGTVGNKLGEAASIQGAMEMRRAVQEGRMRLAVGPFVVDDGTGAIGTVQRFDTSAIVDLHGTCDKHPADLRVVFEERDGTEFLGHPRRFVLVGIDKESLPALARACRGP